MGSQLHTIMPQVSVLSYFLFFIDMQSSFAGLRSTGLKLLPCLLMPERQLLLGHTSSSHLCLKLGSQKHWLYSRALGRSPLWAPTLPDCCSSQQSVSDSAHPALLLTPWALSPEGAKKSPTLWLVWNWPQGWLLPQQEQ